MMIAIKIFLCIIIAMFIGILGGMVVVVIQADLDKENDDEGQNIKKR